VVKKERFGIVTNYCRLS